MLQTNFEKRSDTSGEITVRSGCNSIGGVFVKIGFSKTGVKKDYKLAMKRHLDIDFLMTSSVSWQAVNSFQIKIKIMRCLEIGWDIVSAIFSREILIR